MESKKASLGVHREDIGMLLSAVDGMKDVGKLDILETTFTDYASKGSLAEKLGEVLETLESVQKLQDANSKIREAAGGSPLDPKTIPNENAVEPSKTKPAPYKQYYDGSPAPFENEPGQGQKTTGNDSGKPDTIYYDKRRTVSTPFLRQLLIDNVGC
jgi:hypothetical protein